MIFLQVVMWINQNFLLDEDLTVTGNILDVNFMSLRTDTPLSFRMENSEVWNGLKFP